MFNFEKIYMNQVTDGGSVGHNIGDTGGDGGLGGNNSGAQGSTTVSQSNSSTGSSGTTSQSWLETLPEDIRKDPSLQVFRDPAALAKSYIQTKSMIGRDKVVIPNDKSTEDDWNAFYQKMGRPENADKYEIKLKEGRSLDENFAKGFKEAAFKNGLSSKQVSELANWYDEVSHQSIETQKAQELNQLRESLTTYKTKIGGEEKYMSRVEDARVAVRALAKPELTEFLKTSGLGSRPEMIEFFAELKSMMGEDKIRDGTGVSFGTEDPVVIKNEIENLESKLFGNLNSPHKEEWMAQRDKLYNRLQNARTQSA